jgi:hypothetical protein
LCEPAAHVKFDARSTPVLNAAFINAAHVGVRDRAEGSGMADMVAMVRSELCDRIDRIAAEHGRVAPARLCAMVDEVRFTAAEFGLQPVVTIARALEAAVASEGRGAMTLAYLDAMRDACGCDRADSQAGVAYLASVGVRMVG